MEEVLPKKSWMQIVERFFSASEPTKDDVSDCSDVLRRSAEMVV